MIRLFFLFFWVFLSGCAGLGGSVTDGGSYVGTAAGSYVGTAAGSYVGTAAGRYASVHYRVEGNNLAFAFQNTTPVAMSNLVVEVNQRTPAGYNGSQVGVRLLRMRSFYHFTLPIAHNATGEVTVRYFFIPMRGIAMYPGDAQGRLDIDSMMTDEVSFVFRAD